MIYRNQILHIDFDSHETVVETKPVVEIKKNRTLLQALISIKLHSVFREVKLS